ncbi:MAG: peptide-methionine (S)-S-oxide reductase MsrA [Pseudohongiellaceae bacterium]
MSRTLTMISIITSTTLSAALLCLSPVAAQPNNSATATFAGGCFWCMEPPFDELDGVLSTVSGYAGGHVQNPSYDEVSAGDTGHAEVVRVSYDPDRISYAQLLDVYWRNVDPLDAGGQFCDRGDQYRSEIFAENDSQMRLAKESRHELANSERPGGKIATEISRLDSFFPAEEYHQDYYQKNPIRYRVYKFSCGREARLEEIWEE